MTTENNCQCEGGCCQPKKKSIWPIIIFSFVILSAIGVIAAKLIYKVPAKPATENVGTASGRLAADSCAATGCDTTKGSSCCGK